MGNEIRPTRAPIPRRVVRTRWRQLGLHIHNQRLGVYIFRSNVHTLFGSPSLHYALCRSFVYEDKRVEEWVVRTDPNGPVCFHAICSECTDPDWWECLTAAQYGGIALRLARPVTCWSQTVAFFKFFVVVIGVIWQFLRLLLFNILFSYMFLFYCNFDAAKRITRVGYEMIMGEQENDKFETDCVLMLLMGLTYMLKQIIFFILPYFFPGAMLIPGIRVISLGRSCIGWAVLDTGATHTVADKPRPKDSVRSSTDVKLANGKNDPDGGELTHGAEVIFPHASTLIALCRTVRLLKGTFSLHHEKGAHLEVPTFSGSSFSPNVILHQDTPLIAEHDANILRDMCLDALLPPTPAASDPVPLQAPESLGLVSCLSFDAAPAEMPSCNLTKLTADMDASELRKLIHATFAPRHRTADDGLADLQEGQWHIFADMHFPNCSSFGYSSIWAFVARRKVANPEFGGSDSEQPPHLVQTLLLPVPVKNSGAPAFNEALAAVLLHLGIFQGKDFFIFQGENEVCTSQSAVDYIISVGGVVKRTVPNRHPRQEAWVNSIVRRVRELLQITNLPTVAWASACWSLFHNEIQACRSSGTRPQNSMSSDPKNYLGHLAFSKLYHSDNKLNARAQPILLLHPETSMRHGIHCVFVGADNKLHRTIVDVRGVQVSQELVFQEERDGLMLRKFLGQQLTAQMPSEKLRKISNANLSCSECRIESGLERRGRGRPGQHTFDSGCKRQLQEINISDLPFDCTSAYHETVDSSLKQARMLNLLQKLIRCSAPHEFDTPQADYIGHSTDGISGFRPDLQHRKHMRESLRVHPILRRLVVGSVDTSSLDRDEAILHMTQPQVREVLANAQQEILSNFSNSEFRCLAINVTPKEALSEPAEWLTAIDKEIRGLIEAGVLCLLDPNKTDISQYTLLPSLVVLTKKGQENDVKKARLVACGNFLKSMPEDSSAGFRGQYFTGTSELALFKLLLVIYSTEFASVLDVKQAFTQSDPEISASLRGDQRTALRMPSVFKHKVLWPEIFREYGFEHGKNIYLAVLKSVYGERSAPKSWKRTFEKWCAEHDFQPSSYDDSIYIRYLENSLPQILLVYVDDVWIFSPRGVTGFDTAENKPSHVSSSSELHESLISSLRAQFLTNEPQHLHAGEEIVFLAHTIVKQGNTLRISQGDYIRQCWRKNAHHFSQHAPVSSLPVFQPDWLDEDVVKNEALSSSDATLLRSLINTISYASGSTRPDLSAFLSVLARRQVGGRQRALQKARELFLYMYFSADLQLEFPLSAFSRDQFFQLSCDFDANFGVHEGGVSREGACIFFNGCLIGHRTRLQTTIALSTAEAELAAGCAAARLLMGVANFLHEVLFCTNQAVVPLPLLYGDNESANSIAKGHASIRKVRHLLLPSLYLRQLTRDGRVEVRYKPTSENCADILTKILGEQRVRVLRHLLRLQ